MMLEESNTPELPRRCMYLWYTSIAFKACDKCP